MRPQKVTDQYLVANFMTVFKNKGFEGATLNELANAAGLQKASLYHRFPGGKEEIAASIFELLDTWLTTNLIHVFKNDALPAHDRLAKVLSNIGELYNGGQEVCFIRSISFGTGKELYATQIKEIINKWLQAFYEFGLYLGIEQNEARQKAETTFILVQGSLILSRALDQSLHFRNAMQQISKMYEVSKSA